MSSPQAVKFTPVHADQPDALTARLALDPDTTYSVEYNLVAKAAGAGSFATARLDLSGTTIEGSEGTSASAVAAGETLVLAGCTVFTTDSDVARLELIFFSGPPAFDTTFEQAQLRYDKIG
ncbi:hypothetical protein [Nocardia sp. NPDC059239]|uniref:hypothetical protein n=1 Tax=Nocardia sp. NPDC059239 TaxID=3346785 RepID=UPI0036772E34